MPNGEGGEGTSIRKVDGGWPEESGGENIRRMGKGDEFDIDTFDMIY